MANYLIYPSSVEPVSLDPEFTEDITSDKWYTPLSEPDFTKGQQDWHQFLTTIPLSVGRESDEAENVTMDKWYTPLSIPLFDTPPPPPQAPRHLDMFEQHLLPTATQICLMPRLRPDEEGNFPARPPVARDKR